MKFNLTEGEVKNILEMHSKVKEDNKVISEQVTNLANMSGVELANMRRGSKLAFDTSYNGLSALQKKIVDDKLAGKLATSTGQSTNTNAGSPTNTNTGTQSYGTNTGEPELTLQEKLQALIDDGCVKNGVVVQMGSTNPNKQYAIKQQSTLNPNKSRYFFIDNTYGTVVDGKFKYGTEKWECNSNRIKSDKEKQAKDKAGSESQKAATDANIENLKKEGGWKTYDELIATETKENINNPAMYEKKIVDGVTLYRRTSGRGITSGLDKRQQEVISQFKAKGAKLENEVTALEAKAWTRKLVSPKSDGLFSEDLFMYFPPNTISNTDITTAFEDAVRDQTPESPEDCKKAIEAYYMAFKKKKVFTDDVLSSMKEKVQACKNEFYGSWGAFGGGKTIDGYLNMLSGKASGGPSSYGEDSKWRLK
jgi:hypothetical protein